MPENPYSAYQTPKEDPYSAYQEPEQAGKAEEKPNALMEGVKSVGRFGRDVFAGIGAETIGAGIGALKLGGKLGGLPESNPIAQKLNSPGARALATPPDTMGGKIGSFAERTGELLLPGGAEARLVESAPAGLKLIARAAGAMGTTAVASKIHGEDASTPAAIAGGMTLMGGALAPALAAAGRKIQASTIRPRRLDDIDGFKWSTLDKFKISGDLSQSMEQVDKELGRLRVERNAKIAPGSANVNLDQVFNDALKEVSDEAGDLKYADMGKDAIEQVAKMKKDIHDLLSGNMTTVDISKAENLKEILGTLGAWSFGSGKRDAKVTELVSNKLYLKVKNAIEQSLGPQGGEVKALNKQMQELIPVKNAMLARLPVEERNRMFSLADIAAMLPAVMTGHVGLLSLEGLTRAQKSLRFGSWLNRNAPSAAKAASVAGKVAGGTVSQGSNALPEP